VSGIVAFGDRPACLPDDVIATLRGAITGEEVLQVEAAPEPMSEVKIVEGPLQGLQLLVTRVMPARQRIAVLLEILGTQREVELATDSTIPIQPRSPAMLSALRQDS
jgi:transcriptional antiterminator RfaH